MTTPRKRMEEDALAYQSRLRSLAATLSATEERDRWRLAREIHDTVVQTLSLAGIRLGAARSAVRSATAAELEGRIDGIRELVHEAIRQARSLMSGLTPPLLYELGLGAALTELAERLQAEHNVRFRLAVHAPMPPMPDDLRGFLFQSARELVRNALKHAQAREICVELRPGEGTLNLVVRDDGRGFDPANAGFRAESEGGFGLFSIRERAEGLGGALRLISAPGKGTEAAVTVPVSAASVRLTD